MADELFDDHRADRADSQNSGGIPDRLADWLSEIPAALSRNARGTMTAGMIVGHYLGERRLDRLLERIQGQDGPLNWHWARARICEEADAILLLRSGYAFPQFCQSLQGRGLDQSFLELLLCRRFAEAGFYIVTADHTGIIMAGEGGRLELRAIALEESGFSPSRVREALQRAVTSLVGNDPCFLAFSYPASWTLDRWDIQFELSILAAEGFARNDIPNFFGFYREQLSADGGLIAYSLEGMTEVHPAPRHPSPEISAVMGAAADGDRTASAYVTLMDLVDSAGRGRA